MPTLLKIDTSPLSTSVTRELTAAFVASWQTANPDGLVIERDLVSRPAPPIDGAWVEASRTPEADRTVEQNEVLQLSDKFIGELEGADTFVIGVAMHNFGIPSVLKLWLDQVARSGRTFSYGKGGPQGLLAGKKAIVLIASGGVYEVGTPTGALNFVEPYLKTVLGFLGVTDVTFVTASGVAKLQSGMLDRGTFLKPTLDTVRSLAA